MLKDLLHSVQFNFKKQTKHTVIYAVADPATSVAVETIHIHKLAFGPVLPKVVLLSVSYDDGQPDTTP